MNRQQLGHILKTTRERQGLTRYRVYTDAGIRPDQLNSIEAGNKNYTIDSLLAYVQAVGGVGVVQQHLNLTDDPQGEYNRKK